MIYYIEGYAMIDEAKKAFEHFIHNFEEYKNQDLSESDTRSKLIDHLLINVLGWDESNITREGYNTTAGYYDYRVSTPNFSFIVEAKKNFNSFTLPTKHKKSKINTLFKENNEVIAQIRNYLIEEGLQFGVISNGHQFIIAQFVNHNGVKWKSNNATLFSSLDDISSRFIEFYNILSKTAVTTNLTLQLESSNTYQGKTILSTLDDPHKEIFRNQLSSEITALMQKTFGEIFSNDPEEDNEQFIKECFVANEETKKNRSEIEKLFADLAPKYQNVIPATNTDSIKSQLSQDIYEKTISINNPAPKPIIIIGSKGAGKTTFIKYLFKFTLDEDIRLTHPVLYLDFRKYTTEDIQSNHTKIFKDLTNLLDELYPDLQIFDSNILKKIYKKELRRKQQSIWNHIDESTLEYKTKLSSFFDEKIKDYEEHFIATSLYLIKERRKRLCIIFDNADQMDIKTQTSSFLFAHSINEKSKSGVILSLREGFYSKYKNQPPFDAYYSHVYHISAPKYSEVLQKRINYVLQETEVKKERISAAGALISESKINISITNIIGFLSSAKTTLFGNPNSEMLDFINQTTYPNIREGLKIFRDFLLSGHTQVEEYIYRHYTNPNSPIPIPIHEFVKSVALNNKLVYNSDNSVVYNLFKSNLPDTKDHFIKVKILRFLNEFHTNKDRMDRYIQDKKIIEYLEKEGYPVQHIQYELNELMKNNLIETSNMLSDTSFEIDFNADNSFTITLKGHYYYCKLITKFCYFELIAQDTPIFTKEHFEILLKTYPSPNEEGKSKLNLRLNFVENFISYLHKMERQGNPTGEIIQRIYDHGLTQDIHKITSKLESNNKSNSNY